ncbi:hypothetical protein ACJJTC_019327 [Scirpophaga incertulas]
MEVQRCLSLHQVLCVRYYLAYAVERRLPTISRVFGGARTYRIVKLTSKNVRADSHNRTVQSKRNDSKNIGIHPISCSNENKFAAGAPKTFAISERNPCTFYEQDNGCSLRPLADSRSGDADSSFYGWHRQLDQTHRSAGL